MFVIGDINLCKTGYLLENLQRQCRQLLPHNERAASMFNVQLDKNAFRFTTEDIGQKNVKIGVAAVEKFRHHANRIKDML